MNSLTCCHQGWIYSLLCPRARERQLENGSNRRWFLSIELAIMHHSMVAASDIWLMSASIMWVFFLFSLYIWYPSLSHNIQESISVKFWQIAVDLFFLKVPLHFNHKNIFKKNWVLWKNRGFCKIFFKMHSTNPVSYTHLTLPTICSV